MKFKQYQVDAFASKAFEGNPAAVCPLESWLEDSLMQAIAEENNLSETAFIVPSGKGFDLRWFTPMTEVDLCGHATLASAHVVFEILGYNEPVITFSTRSGDLMVERVAGRLQMNFPAIVAVPCEIPDVLVSALGQTPLEVLKADDYMAVFESEAIVRALNPNQSLLGQLDLRAVIVTAPGTDFDFVSRFFAPKCGIAEDPVTGSAHCKLAPYWSRRLGKTKLEARQVSKRGGNISCEVKGDRVLLTGSAVTFMDAEIFV